MSWKYFIDILVWIYIYRLFFYVKWKREGNRDWILKTMMYVYVGMVLMVTLMPIIISLPLIPFHQYRPMQMVPFDDYINGRGDALRQIVLNVIMMIPFGMLYPAIRKKGFFQCIVVCFLFSLSIELLQPLLSNYRASDITDVITNTAGGAIGYLFFQIYEGIRKKGIPRELFR